MLYPLGQALLWLIIAGIVIYTLRMPIARLIGIIRRTLTADKHNILQAYQEELEQKEEEK